MAGHPVSPTHLEYFLTNEQVTCLCLHCTQPFWNCHHSLGVPAHSSLGDARVTQRHPLNGVSQAGEHVVGVAGIVTCDFVSPPGRITRVHLLSHPSWALLPVPPPSTGSSPTCLPFLPTLLLLPLQAMSAETHPFRCTNPLPATGPSAEVISLGVLLISEALGPKARAGAPQQLPEFAWCSPGADIRGFSCLPQAVRSWEKWGSAL